VHETPEESFAAEKVSRKILGVEFSIPSKFSTVKTFGTELFSFLSLFSQFRTTENAKTEKFLVFSF
jgi:hypothetical protein